MIGYVNYEPHCSCKSTNCLVCQ